VIKPRGLLAGIGFGALAVAGWPLGVVLQTGTSVQAVVLLAHVCGMLAGYAVVVLLGLMSRTPALERGIGADVLARWHARGGRIVLGLILVHAGTAVVAWAQSRREGTLPALWHVLRLPWLTAATIGTLALVAVGLASARSARRRLSYETAGGVGITPMRALFETLAVRPGQDLALLYRARGPEDFVFRHELERIARQRGARLLYLVGGDHECLSAAALLRVVPDIGDRDVYLCASPRMSDAVRAALREAGLPSGSLHEERFAF
jgi:hypothetical protein